MSLRRSLCGIFLSLLAVVWISTAVVAQEEQTPKAELFVGYQWLHPGATVPSPFQPPTAPVARKMGDIPQGAGASFTYNFTPHWGLEADYGGNKNKNGTENTVSIGPRFAWRNEGVTFFAVVVPWVSVSVAPAPEGAGLMVPDSVYVPGAGPPAEDRISTTLRFQRWLVVAVSLMVTTVPAGWTVAFCRWTQSVSMVLVDRYWSTRA